MLELTSCESRVLYEAIEDELRKCINEYGDDTGRRPSKKRLAGLKYAETIIKKLEEAQPKIKGTGFVNLDDVKDCDLDLDNKETSYLKALLEKHIKDNHRELAAYHTPYDGVLGQIDEWTDVAESIVWQIDHKEGAA